MPQSKSSLPATAGLPRRAGALGRVALLGALLAGVPLAGPAQAQSAGGEAKADKSCAIYGPDFRKAPGSDACVRMGASVRADAYRGGALGSAPSQGSSSPSSGSTSTTMDAVDPWKIAR